MCSHAPAWPVLTETPWTMGKSMYPQNLVASSSYCRIDDFGQVVGTQETDLDNVRTARHPPFGITLALQRTRTAESGDGS